MLTLTYCDGPNPTKAFLEESGLPDHVLGRGFRKARSYALPRKGAEDLAQLINMSPGDRCCAIPVAPDTAFKIKTKVANVNTDEEGDLDLLSLATERLPSASITNVELLDDKVRTKMGRRRTKKRITRWKVYGEVSADPLSDFATAAEACKDAEKLVKSGALKVAHVHGEVDGEGSPSYATYRAVQIARRVKIRITYVESTRRDPAPIGWLFFHIG